MYHSKDTYIPKPEPDCTQFKAWQAVSPPGRGLENHSSRRRGRNDRLSTRQPFLTLLSAASGWTPPFSQHLGWVSVCPFPTNQKPRSGAGCGNTKEGGCSPFYCGDIASDLAELCTWRWAVSPWDGPRASHPGLPTMQYYPPERGCEEPPAT